MKEVIIENQNIKLRPLQDTKLDYQNLYEWCQNENVYKYFEQRVLTYDEIVKKYQKRIEPTSNIKVLIIEYNNMPIGLLQYYKFDGDIKLKQLENYQNIYEFDLFIGVNDLYSIGIGTKVIHMINNYLFEELQADCIVLRPFKDNVRGIKCYEKCGYKTIFEYDDQDTIGNKCITVVMIKDKHI